MAATSDARPDGVEPISVEKIEKLGINSRNEVVWDGRRIMAGSKFHLTVPQTVLPDLAAIASLATIATGLNNASIFLCGRNVRWLGCPVQQPPGVPLGAAVGRPVMPR